MKTISQGDLYTVELESVLPIVGEMKGHEVVLWFTNQAIDQETFKKAINTVFAQHIVEEFPSGFMVTMAINAEEITDGQNDFGDTEIFLKEIAAKLLDFLKLTTNWGQDGSADRRLDYDLLD